MILYSNKSHYYPFGMKMSGRYGSENESYRYGFNGMESDDEMYEQEGYTYLINWDKKNDINNFVKLNYDFGKPIKVVEDIKVFHAQDLGGFILLEFEGENEIIDIYFSPELQLLLNVYELF